MKKFDCSFGKYIWTCRLNDVRDNRERVVGNGFVSLSNKRIARLRYHQSSGYYKLCCPVCIYVYNMYVCVRALNVPINPSAYITAYSNSSPANNTNISSKPETSKLHSNLRFMMVFIKWLLARVINILRIKINFFFHNTTA